MKFMLTGDMVKGKSIILDYIGSGSRLKRVVCMTAMGQSMKIFFLCFVMFGGCKFHINATHHFALRQFPKDIQCCLIYNLH